MATQEMQLSQIAAGSPVVRRSTVILAVVAALTVGAVIGRETAITKTQTAVRPAGTISFVGTDSADAARRADVYQAIGALDTPIAFVGTTSADGARRAEVYQALGRLDLSASSTSPRLTDAERRAVVDRLVSEMGS